MADKKGGRPTKSLKWAHSSNLKILIKETEEIEYTTTDHNGYPKFTHSKAEYVRKPCTIILGKKDVSKDTISNYIFVTPSDQVWTSQINAKGNLTSLGVDNANKEITVIIHK